MDWASHDSESSGSVADRERALGLFMAAEPCHKISTKSEIDAAPIIGRDLQQSFLPEPRCRPRQARPRWLRLEMLLRLRDGHTLNRGGGAVRLGLSMGSMDFAPARSCVGSDVFPASVCMNVRRGSACCADSCWSVLVASCIIFYPSILVGKAERGRISKSFTPTIPQNFLNC